MREKTLEMLRAILALSVFTLLHASWHMFSDGKDTYLYDDVTGNVYIKHKKGSKDNEDYFVKMSGYNAKTSSEESNSKKLEMADTNRYKDSEEKKKLMEKARELKSKMLDSTIQ